MSYSQLLIKYGHAYCVQDATEVAHEICPRTEEHENQLSQCPRLRWLRMGHCDAAVLYSLLCVSALHIDVTDGRGFSPLRYALKRDAVRTISERLSDAQSGVSDETITAVTLLAIEEARFFLSYGVIAATNRTWDIGGCT